YISATDSMGNTVTSQPETIAIADTNKPEIIHILAHNTAKAGDKAKVAVKAYDNINLSGAYIMFLDDENITEEKAMTPSNAYGEYYFDINIPNDTSNIEYKVKIVDAAGNAKISEVKTIKVSAKDEPVVPLMPTITLQPVTSAIASEPLVITAVIENAEGGSARFYWRHVGDEQFWPYSMNPIATNSTEYRGTLNASFLTGNIEYYVWAIDTNGNETESDLQQVYITKEKDEPVVIDPTPNNNPGSNSGGGSGGCFISGLRPRFY
ncbi:MAG: hypothetical protein ABIH39_01205, partial [Candidatus Margulisiibacteriota bacterium]